MNAPSVSLVLLRGLMPELPLGPGSVVSAKVLDAKTLLLQGVKLQAKLPEGLEAGQRLRLRVEETTTERIHLKIVGPETAGAALEAGAVPEIPADAYLLSLPGGATARLVVEPDEDGPGGRRSRSQGAVVVRYDSPTLGRMDIRLDGGSAAIHVADGEPAARVHEAAERLAEALARVRGGVPQQVTVHPRRETLDVRA